VRLGPLKWRQLPLACESKIARKAIYLMIRDVTMSKTSLCDWGVLCLTSNRTLLGRRRVQYFQTPNSQLTITLHCCVTFNGSSIITTGIPYALINNSAGKFIAPSLDSTQEAVTKAPAADHLAIASFKYLLLPKDLNTYPSLDERKAKARAHFISCQLLMDKSLHRTYIMSNCLHCFSLKRLVK
jgi:hypothetical protein